jgi:hypothetical protein
VPSDPEPGNQVSGVPVTDDAFGNQVVGAATSEPSGNQVAGVVSTSDAPGNQVVGAASGHHMFGVTVPAGEESATSADPVDVPAVEGAALEPSSAKATAVPAVDDRASTKAARAET